MTQNYKLLQQQQEQLTVLQAQLQTLQERAEKEIGVATSTEVARLQVFNEITSKISDFIITCRLYIRIKIRGTAVEKQIQQILLYVQGGLANMWKENTLKDLKEDLLEYEVAGEFLADIKKEFGRGDKELVKVAELKKLKQERKIMKEFVQEFRRAVRKSGYEGRPLVDKFK